MNTQSEKSRRARLLSVLSVGSLALGVALLIVVFYFAMYKIGVIDLPPALSKLFSGDGAYEIIPGDDGRIYEALNGNKNALREGELLFYDIGDDDLNSLISNLSPNHEYTVEYRITQSDGKISSTKNVTVWRSGSKYRILTENPNGRTERIILSSGTSTTITEYKNGVPERSYTVPSAEAFDISSETGIPSLKTALNSSYVTDLHIDFIRAAEHNIYRLKYVYSDLGTKEELCISFDLGIVLSADTYDGDTNVYSCRTVSVLNRLEGYTF